MMDDAKWQEKQREMMQSINDTFRERIDALNEDYPFLDVRLVSPDDI